MLRAHRIYDLALNMGEDTEIPFEDIADYFAAQRKKQPKTRHQPNPSSSLKFLPHLME